MVRSGANNSSLNLIVSIPATKTIDNENIGSGVEVVNCSLSVELIGLSGEGDVGVSPPDLVLGDLILDDSLFSWDSSHSKTGIRDQGSGI